MIFERERQVLHCLSPPIFRLDSLKIELLVDTLLLKAEIQPSSQSVQNWPPRRSGFRSAAHSIPQSNLSCVDRSEGGKEEAGKSW